MSEVKCEHCEDPVNEEDQTHWTEDSAQNGYGHRGLCCDCMDLSCGMPLDKINEERAAKGQAPITKPWQKLGK